MKKRKLFFLGMGFLLLRIVFWAGVASEPGVVLFEENFPKDQSGNIGYSRSFVSSASAVTISLQNGTNGPADHVGNGKIFIDGMAYFGNTEFKVVGTVSKTVPLAAGQHALDIQLGGKTGGLVTVRIEENVVDPGPVFPPGTPFVSMWGSDTYDPDWGTEPDKPYRTISFALERAQISGAPLIAVADGIYNESISLVEGTDLRGGYNEIFTEHDLASLRPETVRMARRE